MEFGTFRGSFQYSSDSPKNANEISIGATASKVCNIHSDEMSRVGHLLSYPGAASLITKTRSSMDRPTLDAAHLGSQSAQDDANPYFQLVMDFFNDLDPASDFNMTCSIAMKKRVSVVNFAYLTFSNLK